MVYVCLQSDISRERQEFEGRLEEARSAREMLEQKQLELEAHVVQADDKRDGQSCT